MTRSSGFVIGLSTAVVLFAAAGAYADSNSPPPTDTATADTSDNQALANVKTSENGKIQYVSGGVGVGGMQAFTAAEHDYNLKLLFAANSGAYLSHVSVNVKNGKGDSVLTTTTEGPVLLVKMPPGKYNLITQTDSGATVTQVAEVGKDHLASYVLHYPTQNQ